MKVIHLFSWAVTRVKGLAAELEEEESTICDRREELMSEM